MRLKSVFNATIIQSGKTFIPKPGPSLSFGILMKSLFYFSVSTLSTYATKQMHKFYSDDLYGVESPLSHGNCTMKYVNQVHAFTPTILAFVMITREKERHHFPCGLCKHPVDIIWDGLQWPYGVFTPIPKGPS